MNDPRITAYALGELTGRAREEFERDLAASENLQRELNETTQIAESLGNLPMPTDTLIEEERHALRDECAKNITVKRNRFPLGRILVLGGGLAAAACLIFALSMPAITGALSRPSPEMLAELRARNAEGREIAKRDRGSVVVADAPAAAASPTSRSSNAPLIAANEAKQNPLNKPVDFGRITELDDQRSAAVGAKSELTSMLKENVDKLGSSSSEKEGMESALDSSSVSVPAQAGSREIVATSVTTRSGATASVQAFSSGYASPASAESIDGDVPIAGRFFRSEDESLGKTKRPDHNTETYDFIQENVFLEAKDNPLSTLSIDVDTASYANVRRFLQNDQLPPAGAIRTEELINYFSYDYPQPEGDAPFSVNLEVSRAPWDASRELVRIGLQGREIPASERGPANLVFLVDVSGSMNQPDKLPLLKRSLQALVENLSPQDRVALVVYAGSSGLVLPSTPGTEKTRILAALENLQAGGSTNGASGIQLAYDTARKNFLKEGGNRVILCTDGDFNVGTTNQSELVRLIEGERASGVFLSVLGFGTGNLKDSTMEKLADKGSGNYAYIDSFTEGRKVLVEQMGATLFTIAKDVKIQVEFNPARVAGYRLIGYENRLLAKEDFNDDKKDAGEIGAGHSVTALYEIIPAGQPLPDQPSVDPLKYQTPPSDNPRSAIPNPPATDAQQRPGIQSQELLTVKLRYKAPDGDKSKLLVVPLAAPEIPAFAQATSDFQFATAVAAFGMKLRGSPTAGDIGWSDIQKIVRANLGEDPGSYRAEFLTLIEKASRLAPSGHAAEE